MNGSLVRSKLRNSIEGGSSSFFMNGRDKIGGLMESTSSMKDDASIHSASTGFPEGSSTYKGTDDEDKAHKDGSNVRCSDGDDGDMPIHAYAMGRKV